MTRHRRQLALTVLALALAILALAPRGLAGKAALWAAPLPGPVGAAAPSGVLDASIQANGQYRACVTNNDDDSQTVYYKTELEKQYSLSFTAPSGGYVCSSYTTVLAGNRTVSVRWTDPDTGQELSLTSGAEFLWWDQTATFEFTIRGNPWWYVRTTNNDDDPETISYKLDIETSYHSYVVPPGRVIDSAWWPGPVGTHHVNVKWTDPDSGQLEELDSDSKDLELGWGKGFLVTIPRYSLHAITVSASPAAGGAPTGGGVYDYGASATVHANPAGAYTFLHWTEGAATVSTSTDYSFTVTGDRTLVAHYAQKTATPTGTVSPGAPKTATPTRTATATPSPTQTSIPGQTATSTPTPVVSLRLPVILSGY